MKKILVLVLALMLMFALAACGGNNTPNGDNSTSSSPQVGVGNVPQRDPNADIYPIAVSVDSAKSISITLYDPNAREQYSLNHSQDDGQYGVIEMQWNILFSDKDGIAMCGICTYWAYNDPSYPDSWVPGISAEYKQPNVTVPVSAMITTWRPEADNREMYADVNPGASCSYENGYFIWRLDVGSANNIDFNKLGKIYIDFASIYDTEYNATFYADGVVGLTPSDLPKPTPSDTPQNTPGSGSDTAPATSDWVGTYTNGSVTLSIVSENNNLILYISKDGNQVHRNPLNVGGPDKVLMAGGHDDPWKSIDGFLELQMSEDYQTITVLKADLSEFGVDGSFEGEYKRQ